MNLNLLDEESIQPLNFHKQFQQNIIKSSHKKQVKKPPKM